MTLDEKLNRLEQYIESMYKKNGSDDHTNGYLSGVEHALYLSYPHQRRKIHQRLNALFLKYFPF